MVQFIGYLAAICTTLAFIPQALLIWKTKDTRSISLGMYSIFTLGVCLWLVFGILTQHNTIIFANIVTGLLALSILIMKIINFKKENLEKNK